MLKRVSAVLAAFALGLISFGAQAAGAPIDLTPLTASVDFTSVTAAVLAIAAILMGVYVAIKGVRIVIGMVRGG